MHRWEEESGIFFISGKKCLDFREYHEKIEKMSTFHDFWGIPRRTFEPGSSGVLSDGVADVFFFFGGGVGGKVFMVPLDLLRMAS